MDNQKLILVAGHPAAGKTTYSRLMQNERGVLYECLDEQRYQAAAEAGLDVKRDDRAKVLEAMKKAEDAYFPRMEEIVKGDEQDIIVIERPFHKFEGILHWKNLLPDHRKIEVHFLFTPDVGEAIDRDLKRSFADETALELARESGHLVQELHQVMELHKASPTVMKACVEVGFHVKLIENVMGETPEENDYRVVAEAQDGLLEIRNRRAYGMFMGRENLQADRETAENVADTIGFAEGEISFDRGVSLFAPALRNVAVKGGTELQMG